MNPLDSLDPEELVAMSDGDFQDTIQKKARALAAQAMDTIADVMISSDDDQARLTGAFKTLDLAGARDKSSALPFGITDEVFRIALAGFGQLASIAACTSPIQTLRDVTPARTDPRHPDAVGSLIPPKPRRPVEEEEEDPRDATLVDGVSLDEEDEID